MVQHGLLDTNFIRMTHLKDLSAWHTRVNFDCNHQTIEGYRIGKLNSCKRGINFLCLSLSHWQNYDDDFSGPRKLQNHFSMTFGPNLIFYDSSVTLGYNLTFHYFSKLSFSHTPRWFSEMPCFVWGGSQKFQKFKIRWVSKIINGLTLRKTHFNSFYTVLGEKSHSYWIYEDSFYCKDSPLSFPQSVSSSMNASMAGTHIIEPSSRPQKSRPYNTISKARYLNRFN